ncbi:MAG TPA: magnesium transporter [Kofleriaceae bacterium]|nr:magnesium transporter [Kofleriaceae bacterium]
MAEVQRHTDRLAATIRRLVRRGATRNLSRLLGKVRPEDVAAAMDGLTPEEQQRVFAVALRDYQDVAGEVLVGMEPAARQALVEQLAPQEIVRVIDPLAVDDAAEVVESLSDELREGVLELVSGADQEELQTHLDYREDTAGRLMTTEFFALPETTSVGEAIGRIQEVGDFEMIFYLYVTNEQGQLAGVTSLRQLLLSAPSTMLEEIMNRSVIQVRTDTDQEEVARLVSHYDLLAVPVTDEAERLVGIVTVDDVVDVVQEEAEEDILKMVGTTEDELIHRERSWRVTRIRLPWILINLAGQGVTALLYKRFELTLGQALFLVFFAPLIMGMGGNVGSQTSTIAVRSIATGRLTSGQGRGRAFLAQQMRVGALLGLLCAPIAAVGAYLLEGNATFAVLVGLALFLAITLASLNGSLVPLVFERFGVDPAVASGPMVSTLSDIIGLTVYFGMAAAAIQWLA